VLAEMDAWAIVLWRTLLSAPLFLLWARGAWPSREHLPRIIAGGLLLGAHFLLWVKAFDLTDFASNLLLLVFQPIAAAVLGISLGERPTARTWTAVGLSVAGLAVIAGGDFSLGPRALLGDAMCIAGAFAIALFYVVTRDARAATPLSSFMGVTMLVVAALAAPFALLGDGPVAAYPARSWGWLAALVVLTTVGGHGFMNLAARHVRLFTLNVVIVLEPAIAIAMGAAMIGKTVTALQLGGGVLLAAAVVVGLSEERSQKSTEAETPPPNQPGRRSRTP
jgi:drug/metabolite transporter (DMT)-like permease